ncbi:MAG: DUF4249 family protein [Cyclobacteriaceae bacterium]
MKKHLMKLLLCAALFSCEERFNPILERLEEENYIINGYINQSLTDPYIVTIQQTKSGGVPTPIFGALVEVVDEDGNREQFFEQDIGTYVSKMDIVKGRPGTSYYLEVKMNNGDMFRSKSDRMPELKVENNMTWRQERITYTSDLGTDVTVPHIVVDLQANNQGTEESYNIWWVLEETFQFNEVDFPDPFGSVPPPCYITQTYGSGAINLFTNTGFTGSTYNVRDIFVRELDESFLAKHIFSTYQHSVSNDYYEYLKSLEALVENSGGLFDTPPGKAVGNFEPIEGTDIAPLGFFSAVLTDTTRIAVYPSEISFKIPNLCEFIAGKPPTEYDSQCRNCEVIPRSTKVQPKFWTSL